MDTALITGMLETNFLPDTQLAMDVKLEKTESFSKIFESSLKNNDVGEAHKKELPEKQLKVDEEDETLVEEDKDEEEKKDVYDTLEELLEGTTKEDGKTKKKEKKTKDEEKLNNFISQNGLTKLIKKDNLIKEDVESEKSVEIKVGNVNLEDVSNEAKDVIKLVGIVKNGDGKNLELTPEEKLNSLLSKLDVELNGNMKIKDESEKVIKVGPQNVETEKIELNINDVEELIDVNGRFDPQNVIASEYKDINNPAIQNPFKLKRLSEKSELSEETFTVGTEVLEDGEVLNKDEEQIDVLNINNQDVLNANDVKQGEKDSFKDKDDSNKEDKIKVKDFRNKKDVNAEQEVFDKEDVKIEDKFEIKEVNNVRKFEDFVEQDVLDQVTEKLEVSLFDNKSEMVIKLKPNDLGKVTVKISIENGVMNAKFLADSIKVKETLESNLNNLKETLKEQGLSVQDLSVSVDSGRSQNQTFEQNRVIYFDNKKDYQTERTVNYEDTYYEFSNINTNNIRNYWMDSTVSFLA